jgi:hypothetical protein
LTSQLTLAISAKIPLKSTAQADTHMYTGRQSSPVTATVCKHHETHLNTHSYYGFVKCFTTWLGLLHMNTTHWMQLSLIAMMTETVCASETLVYFDETTWRYIPERYHLQFPHTYF